MIRYSRTLKAAHGVALCSSTAVGVIFSINEQQDGGTAVWMETQNVTPDSKHHGYRIGWRSLRATGTALAGGADAG